MRTVVLLFVVAAIVMGYLGHVEYHSPPVAQPIVQPIAESVLSNEQESDVHNYVLTEEDIVADDIAATRPLMRPCLIKESIGGYAITSIFENLDAAQESGSCDASYSIGAGQGETHVVKVTTIFGETADNLRGGVTNQCDSSNHWASGDEYCDVMRTPYGDVTRLHNSLEWNIGGVSVHQTMFYYSGKSDDDSVLIWVSVEQPTSEARPDVYQPVVRAYLKKYGLLIKK